ncbi:MAG: DEAD/DEAH box helicase [Nanoarchaeota archaeon]|nr:DEAD/DEAH box helicase [Nanoarchaeota archaeon]
MKPRLYQETIFHECTLKNCLVVLPTGMGKTLIAVMLAKHRLKSYPNSKILMLAPTRPLCQQHFQTFKDNIETQEITMFTGMIKSEKRAELWKQAKVIISTPQGVENDIMNGKIDLKDVSLLVLDEAHRAVGDYSYVWIAQQYHKKAKYPRILGMTASPGSDEQVIDEVCQNIVIESIEIRTDTDPDVRPYIQEVKLDWKYVELPPSFKEIQKFLKDCIGSKLKEMKDLGILKRPVGTTRREVLGMQAELQAEIAQGNKAFEVLRALSIAAEIMKVQHALELLETQGITSLDQYMGKIMADSLTSKVKAVQNLAKDINFKSALIKTSAMAEQGIQHPKLEELKRIIKEEFRPGMKVLVFNQYRDSAQKIEQELNDIPGIRASIFVGQMKKGTTGMTQKKQLEMIDSFRNGEINILISTSVGEEGLDIPQVDMVIFYEAVPSAIRTIQRRGRTGRTEKGRVIMLTTKDTRDEAYRWSAHHKEKRMFRTLQQLKSKIHTRVIEQQHHTLESYMEKVKIIVDHRQKSSAMIKELMDMNAEIEVRQLDSADIQPSSRVGVEIKRVPDFVDSIIDGRLLEQLRLLKQNYERPLLILEGSEDIFKQRNIHPNAIRGMLSTVTVSYGIPILNSRNLHETAALLYIIAKREQDKEPSDFTPHALKPSRTLKEQQEYIVSALPGIGMTLARPLLKHFKTIKNLIIAPQEDLQDVDLIGKKKAEKIREVLDGEYDDQ